jgi:hypothetical protein
MIQQVPEDIEAICERIRKMQTPNCASVLSRCGTKDDAGLASTRCSVVSRPLAPTALGLGPLTSDGTYLYDAG